MYLRIKYHGSWLVNRNVGFSNEPLNCSLETLVIILVFYSDFFGQNGILWHDLNHIEFALNFYFIIANIIPYIF